MTGGRSCQSSSNRLASEGLLVFIPILHIKINRTMKIGIVVATHGRATLVRELLERMQSQSRLPDEVVLSAVESSDLPELTKLDFPVKVLLGKPGSCRQRNDGIEYLIGRAEVVLFLDDDFWMSRHYLEEIARLFTSDSSIVGITGKVIADGATSQGFSPRQADEMLKAYQPAPDGNCDRTAVEVLDTYGCNMAFRMAGVGSIRFDENLPLYGWQEDVDFSAQVRKQHGRLVKAQSAWGVHLGTKMGKTSGVRFGYSQVINPLYISKKGNMRLHYAIRLIFRNILSNAAKSVLPEPYIDRRGRLRGNLTGLIHLLQGRLDPTYVLRI
jgi:glycosyltransferase involved in cell wall biosynthesis